MVANLVGSVVVTKRTGIILIVVMMYSFSGANSASSSHNRDSRVLIATIVSKVGERANWSAAVVTLSAIVTERIAMVVILVIVNSFCTGGASHKRDSCMFHAVMVTRIVAFMSAVRSSCSGDQRNSGVLLHAMRSTIS